MTNQKWELTYGIRREDLDDDLTGTVAQAVSRIRSGAGSTSATWDKLIFNVVKNNGRRSTARRSSMRRKGEPEGPRSATYANTTSGRPHADERRRAPHGDDRARRSRRRPDQREPQRAPRAPALERPPRARSRRPTRSSTRRPRPTRARSTSTRALRRRGGAAPRGELHRGPTPTGTCSTPRTPRIAGSSSRREPVELVTLFDLADANVPARRVRVGRARAVPAAAGNPKKIFRRTADPMAHATAPTSPASCPAPPREHLDDAAQDAAVAAARRDGRPYLRTRYSTPVVVGTASTSRGRWQPRRVGPPLPCVGTTRSAAGTRRCDCALRMRWLAARRVLGQDRALRDHRERAGELARVHRRQVRRVARLVMLRASGMTSTALVAALDDFAERP